MGGGGRKKHAMLRVEEVDISAVKYSPQVIKAPHLSGFTLRFFVWLVEAPLLRSIILSVLKRQNGIPKMLEDTVIPEPPMFRPEFPPQAPESGVVDVGEDKEPPTRVESALRFLPPYDPSHHRSKEADSSFLYWTVRDYAHAYRSNLATPTIVAERVISVVEDFNNKEPSMPLLISFDAEEVRKQAAASTQRFLEGKPLSILDGVFMAIKDDVDCYPYPTKGLCEIHTRLKDIQVALPLALLQLWPVDYVQLPLVQTEAVSRDLWQLIYICASGALKCDSSSS